MTDCRRALVIAGLGLSALVFGTNRARADDLGWLRDAAALATPVVPHDCPGVVLETSIDMRADSHLNAHIRERRVVRVLTVSGADLRRFSFLLEPGARLQSLRAWRLEPGGKPIEANRDEVVESTLLPGMYTDSRRVGLGAPDAKPGDVVAAECEYDEVLPFPGYLWVPQADGLATSRALFRIEPPRGWRVGVHGYGTAPRVESTDGARSMYVLGPLPSLAGEPGCPPVSALAPRVSVRLIDTGSGDPFADWRGVAAWYHALSGPQCSATQSPADLEQRVTATDPVAVVSGLAREVQQSVQYAAIELGRRRWVPDPASQVWERRYGDCKDKATLLVAALEARGISARPALTCTRDQWPVDSASADPQQFNHCIVAIAWPAPTGPAATTVTGPSGRRWTFFDPTSTSIPLGMLPTQDAGAYAVIADPAEGLVRLPPLGGSVLRTVSRLTLDDAGGIAGTITVSAVGPIAAELCERFAGSSADERTRLAANWLHALPGHAEVLDTRWSAADTCATGASLELSVRIHGATSRAGAGWVVRPLFLAPAEAPPAADSARTLPYLLGGPIRYDDRLELVLPAGRSVEDMRPVSWSDSIGEYRMEQRGHPGAVVVERRLELRAQTVPASEFPRVQALLRSAFAGDNASLLVR